MSEKKVHFALTKSPAVNTYRKTPHHNKGAKKTKTIYDCGMGGGRKTRKKRPLNKPLYKYI